MVPFTYHKAHLIWRDGPVDDITDYIEALSTMKKLPDPAY